MPYFRNQRGVVVPAILVLITVVGIVVYLLASSLLSFENPFFGQLFPKKSSRAAGIVDLSLIPSTVTVGNTKTFLIDLVIDAKTEQPSAMELGLNYDTSSLEVVTFEKGPFFAKELMAPQIDAVNGKIDVHYAQEANTLKSGSGTVATIAFKAINPTAPTVNVAVDLTRTRIAAIGKGSTDVLGVINNSTITVIAESPVTKTAEFSLSPATGSVTTPNELPVQVRAKSAAEAANLFSAKINFDPALLEVARIETAGTFITQWVSDTNSFNNTAGTVSVIGGVPDPGYQTGASPELMATIVFKGKAEGLASVSFDGTSTVYRNSDTADILLSSGTGSYTVSAAPTPSPSPIPSPSASVAPSPSPSPSASPSTTPAPVACSITNAAWVAATNPMTAGKVVNMSVTTTGDCSNKSLAFTVLEDDGILGTDPVSTKAITPVKIGSNNQTTSSWLTEFQVDLNGINNPPEYFFNVQIVGDPVVVRSSGPDLQVSEPAAGTLRKGDANRDSRIDLADMSVLLSNWNRNQDLNDELDHNDDGVINAVDFAGLRQLLVLEGVIN